MTDERVKRFIVEEPPSISACRSHLSAPGLAEAAPISALDGWASTRPGAGAGFVAEINMLIWGRLTQFRGGML